MAAWTKAWVWGRCLAGIGGGLESRRWHGCVSPIVSDVYFQVEVSAKCRSLVQGSPIDCGVSECDSNLSDEESKTHWGCQAMRKRNINNDKMK